MFCRRIANGSSPEGPCQFVHRAFDGEGRLRRAIAAEAAARHHIGIDRVAVGLLVVAAVDGERAGKRRSQRLAAMPAIGAGVGDDMDLDRRQRAVAFGAELHTRRHLMARRRGGELFLAGVFPFDRPTCRQRGKDAQVLGDHLLLAAEAAADTFGEHVHVANGQARTGD